MVLFEELLLALNVLVVVEEIEAAVVCCDVADAVTAEETGIKEVRVSVTVAEAVTVVTVITVSVERMTDVWFVELFKPKLDCDPWSTPCSGLTIAIAKMRETITEIAIRDANTSSNLSWRFIPSPRTRGKLA